MAVMSTSVCLGIGVQVGAAEKKDLVGKGNTEAEAVHLELNGFS